MTSLSSTASTSLPVASTSPAVSVWENTSWRGESAWSSVQGPVRAVVTAARDRLIYLGTIDGAVNLLNAPYPQVLPNAEHRWPNQGGHRFWLGPQRRWVWPPLVDWEYSAAASASVEAGVLTLHQPHVDRAYPAVIREYAWEGTRLRCTARWKDEGRPYFGMHVVPVDLPFIGTARLLKSADVPLGFVNVQMDGALTDGFLPHPAVTLDENHLTLCGGLKVMKAGFTPQTLTVGRQQGWQLSVIPGPSEGVALESPDHGYVSQIWVGAPEHDLAELEQLTPYLRGDTKGECASTIFLEATPPSGNVQI